MFYESLHIYKTLTFMIKKFNKTLKILQIELDELTKHKIIRKYASFRICPKILFVQMNEVIFMQLTKLQHFFCSHVSC